MQRANQRLMLVVPLTLFLILIILFLNTDPSRRPPASVILAGLIPILWSQGTGSDVMKRIAAPVPLAVTPYFHCLRRVGC